MYVILVIRMFLRKFKVYIHSILFFMKYLVVVMNRLFKYFVTKKHIYLHLTLQMCMLCPKYCYKVLRNVMLNILTYYLYKSTKNCLSYELFYRIL